MQKGKFGIAVWFYAVLAFVLAFMGQVLLSGLLFGFVILAEKNEWLIRQVMQAFVLCICGSILQGLVSGPDIVSEIPILNTVVSAFAGLVSGAIHLLILICVIIGIVRTAKGQDAAIPLVSGLVDRAFGIVKQKVNPNVTPQNGACYYHTVQPPVSAPPAAEAPKPVDPEQQQ